MKTVRQNAFSSALIGIQRVLRIKPSPLRRGSSGPYIFIHINKTAGTSIGNAIGLPIKNHLTAKEVIQKIGKKNWQDAYKFTVVRNPWDKVVSLFEYRRKKNKTEIASSGMTFTDWVNLSFGPVRDPFYYDNVKSFQAQVEWLKNDEGIIDTDFIAKFESLSSDFDQIKAATGVSANLQHLNQSHRKDYRSYYTPETRAIIAKRHAEDIAAFAYTFD
jgi:chondroitin 4-sulfotransferase 11